MDLKSKLEEKKISDQAKLVTYVSYDDEHLYFEINYLNGKFVSEKVFPNNYKSVELIEELKQQYRNEHDVKKHFGIGQACLD